jgi:hypothetical protein
MSLAVLFWIVAGVCAIGWGLAVGFMVYVLVRESRDRKCAECLYSRRVGGETDGLWICHNLKKKLIITDPGNRACAYWKPRPKEDV